MALVIKYYVQFAFLFVHTVFWGVLNLIGVQIKWFEFFNIFWREVKYLRIEVRDFCLVKNSILTVMKHQELFL